jgi:hypothetical protein
MKILLISPIFFPDIFPESHLMTKQLGEVKNVDVLTADSRYLRRTDDSMTSYVQQNFGKINRIKFLELMKKLPINRFHFFSKNPDIYRVANYFYVRAAKKLVKKSQYDMIITWSQPHSCHLIGLKLKKIYGEKILWVTHFSDPWVDNPYIHRGQISKRYNTRLRNRIFDESNAILYTNEHFLSAEGIHKNKAWKDKSYEIPHCFVNELFPSAKRKPSKEINIRYIGNFYGSRKADIVFDILRMNKKKIEMKFPEYTFNLDFYGSSQTKIEFDSELIPKNFKINIYPQVNYLDSLKLMKDSDLLLVIDAPFQTSPFLPSKVVDYLGSRVPIFAITPDIGPTTDLINSYGGWASSYRSNEEISINFIEALNVITAGPKCTMNDVIRSNYSSTSTSKIFKNVIENLVKQKNSLIR